MADYGFVNSFPLPEDPAVTGTPLQPAQLQAPAAGFAGFQNPEPPELAVIHQPAATPAEVEARKEGWLQIIQRVTSNPNLMRAVGMFGAQLAQPIPQGQTFPGHLSGALQLGTTAYDYGKEAEFQRARLLRKDTREEEMHGLDVQGRQLQNATTAQRLPGIAAETEIKIKTKEDVIKAARTERELKEQQLANAKSTAEKQKIELESAKRTAAIEKQIPDAERLQAFRDELKKPGAELARIRDAGLASRAAAGASGASARAATARARQDEQELKDLGTLTTEERLVRGRSKGNVSAQVQMTETFKNLFKQANPKATDSEAAAATVRFLENKKTDDLEQYMKFTELEPPKRGESPEAHFKRFQQIQNLVKGPASATSPEADIPVGTRRSYQGKTYEYTGGGQLNRANWKEVK